MFSKWWMCSSHRSWFLTSLNPCNLCPFKVSRVKVNLDLILGKCINVLYLRYVTVYVIFSNTVIDCITLLRRVFAELCEFCVLSGMRSKDENWHCLLIAACHSYAYLRILHFQNYTQEIPITIPFDLIRNWLKLHKLDRNILKQKHKNKQDQERKPCEVLDASSRVIDR